jgi:hypothetical protein
LILAGEGGIGKGGGQQVQKDFIESTNPSVEKVLQSTISPQTNKKE